MKNCQERERRRRRRGKNNMAVILDSTPRLTPRRRTKKRDSHNRKPPMKSRTTVFAFALLVCLLVQRLVEGLRISGFRVPSYVPITLPMPKHGTNPAGSQPSPPTSYGPAAKHPLELNKPILFDCDYDYNPAEDSRLAVRWFRNKEPEPFYQWLPELNERHLADWIRPLVNQSFVSDPLDPMKRYRSLLIKRLSMNLTGSYTCLVSSLAGQDSRQAQLVVYQPPIALTFVQRIYPPPSLAPNSFQYPAQRLAAPQLSIAPPSTTTRAPSPTQFRGLGPALIVRPPNNINNTISTATQPQQHQHQPNGTSAGRLVYTHDGRPIKRFRRQISAWQLERRLGSSAFSSQQPRAERYHIQLHHFECQATQVRNPAGSQPSPPTSYGPAAKHPLELNKPILFDCDYDYNPAEDSRLAVRWFRNKEPEPFYQWLPELNERHLADWIRPLVNQSFVSDPLDPMKRYRSLLIKRLSMNLTGSYTCLVSSLAGQDSRQAQLVVYQPPIALTFVQRIYPPPSLAPNSFQYPAQRLAAPQLSIAPPSTTTRAPSPTQFRGLGPALIVRPPNNINNTISTATQPQQHQHQPNGTSAGRLVYTHDGRPIKRFRRQISAWQLERRLGSSAFSSQQPRAERYHIQLHHFECQATQVSPRPVLVLTVKRNSEAIAQYLHDSSTTTLRPHQVEASDYYGYGGGGAGSDEPLLITLYDITVSATVALNVSLPTSGGRDVEQQQGSNGPELPLAGATVLQFRRGQRMSFECQLEITGTEFEQRKRIQVNEEEVYQFAELEERKRQQQQRTRQQLQEPSHQLLGQEQLQQQQPALGSNSAAPDARRLIGVSHGVPLFHQFHLGVQLAIVALISLLALRPLDHRI